MRNRGFRYITFVLLLGRGAVCAEVAATPMSDAEREEFLQTARILHSASTAKGVTGSARVTLAKGDFRHDAHIQCIDESKRSFTTDRATELNFKDTYKFNIAAYRLARMLGISSLPTTVERKVAGKTCSIDWWVDNVMMDEATRKAKKIDTPNIESWNNQMYVVRIFDQLIYNVDRNLTNMLILKNWDLVMIDHSRSFRLLHALRNPKNLGKCDRSLLDNLRALDRQKLMKRLAPYCTRSEVEGVIARRDLIVKFFDQQIKEKGESAVLYDLGTIQDMRAAR